MKEKLEPIEVLEKNRRVSLIGFTIFFVLWQVGQIITLNFEDLLSASMLVIFHSMTFVGALGWVGFSIYFFRARNLVKAHPQLSGQFNDERWCLIKNKAMSYGFIFSLAAAAIFLAISVLLEAFGRANVRLSGQFVAHSILVIAVVSSWISYLILDTQE